MTEYFLKGKKYTGPKHKMPNGKYDTGANHTPASKPLTTKKKERKDNVSRPSADISALAILAGK